MPLSRTKTTHTRRIAIGFATAMLLVLGSLAWAEPDMGPHYGMRSSDHCDRWKEKGMGHHGKHGMHPHNAAIHFLKMGEMLDLSDEQTRKLTKMRDEYIEKNATAEDQLKVAYDDIARTLYGDEVDLEAANALIAKVGKLESQLWHAYAQQLHDIKAMLTPEQRSTLKSMWDMPRRHMGGMPMRPRGDMPMRGM